MIFVLLDWNLSLVPRCSGEPICHAQRELPGLPGQRPVRRLLCRHAEGAGRHLEILLQDQAGGWWAVRGSRAQRLLDWHGWRANQQGEHSPSPSPSHPLSLPFSLFSFSLPLSHVHTPEAQKHAQMFQPVSLRTETCSENAHTHTRSRCSPKPQLCCNFPCLKLPSKGTKTLI